ncbi:MAG: polysaccharide deacetylase family protein [Lachnospiraceae bacterium]|nr:polysaccharide deacetylase family protein [Lachnospiraceae bacterium]
MDREVLRKRIARNKRNILIHNCIKVGVCVVAALGLITLGWHFAEPIMKRAEVKIEEDKKQVAMVQAGTSYNEDGSQDAMIATLTSGQTVTSAAPGWQVDATGWWYAADEQSSYQNGWLEIEGQKYHFGADGYMDTGWTAIAGQGYYFDDHGIQDPNKSSSKMLALTFDDGPGPNTGRILDVLEQYGARATFFMLGTSIERYGADTIPRMKALGCDLGNHSYDHTYLADKTVDIAQDQFARTDALIAQYNNGTGASVVRFPYGNFTKEQAAATNRSCWFWNSDTMDWDSPNAAAVAQNISSSVEDGALILMHDTQDITVEACLTMIPQLVNDGWQLVTVRELAQAKGYDIYPGATYYGFTDRIRSEGNDHVYSFDDTHQ